MQAYCASSWALCEIHRRKQGRSCDREIVLSTSFGFKAIAADEKDADQAGSFRAGIMDLLGVTVAVQTDTKSSSWNVSQSGEPGRDDLPGEESSQRVTAGHCQEYENPSI